MFAGKPLGEELLWAGACGGDPEIVRMASSWWIGRATIRDGSAYSNSRCGSGITGPAFDNNGWDRGTYVTCLRLILERCDPNVRGRTTDRGHFGLTILHSVAGSREHLTPEERVAFASAIIDAGARLDARDNLLRSTPLGWACRWGRVELVKLFLERGADPVELDAEPWARPRAWAEKMGMTACGQCLRRWRREDSSTHSQAARASDLDQLRRQAKELLEAFLAARLKAVAEVNARYRGADAAEFALHDAQLVLARSYGFDSWPKLKAYVDGVTVQRLATRCRPATWCKRAPCSRPVPNWRTWRCAEQRASRAALRGARTAAGDGAFVDGAWRRRPRGNLSPPRRDQRPHHRGGPRLCRIVAIIDEAEQRRREAHTQASADSNAAVTAAQDALNDAIWNGDEAQAIAISKASRHWAMRATAAAGLRCIWRRRGSTGSLCIAARSWHGRDRRGPGDRTPLDLADGTGWRKAGGLEKYPPSRSCSGNAALSWTARSAVALGEADWLRARHSEGALVIRYPGPAGCSRSRSGTIGRRCWHCFSISASIRTSGRAWGPG